MSAKGHYIMIDETILSDTKVEDLIMALGYEGFGLYIAFLTLIRHYDSTGYRVPVERLEIIARRHLNLHTERELDAFSDFILTAIKLELLRQDDEYIWSERRRIDLLKQEEIKRKQSLGGKEAMEKRYASKSTY